jgi:hypothetical protein
MIPNIEIIVTLIVLENARIYIFFGVVALFPAISSSKQAVWFLAPFFYRGWLQDYTLTGTRIQNTFSEF